MELGTAVVTLTFTDEDGDTVIPTNLAWELRDLGTRVLINNRDFSSGSFSGNTLVLTGLDLALISAGDQGKRRLGVQGLYDSSAGTDLPLKGEFEFSICKLLTQGDY